ncbi:hypothetical protein SAMN05518849_12079 [Sphingobium sp. AP50]|nr:hypothetical protein SAMN05518849_12079 [Sphingobium sp. AP50]
MGPRLIYHASNRFSQQHELHLYDQHVCVIEPQTAWRERAFAGLFRRGKHRLPSPNQEMTVFDKVDTHIRRKVARPVHDDVNAIDGQDFVNIFDRFARFQNGNDQDIRVGRIDMRGPSPHTVTASITGRTHASLSSRRISASRDRRTGIVGGVDMRDEHPLRAKIERRLDQDRRIFENANEREYAAEVGRPNVVFNIGSPETAMFCIDNNEIDSRERHDIGRSRIKRRNEDADWLPALTHQLDEMRSRVHAAHYVYLSVLGS